MMHRVTWLDRLRAVARNCRRDPAAAWFAVLLLVMIAAIVFGLAGCDSVGAAGVASSDNLRAELAQTKADLAKAKEGTTILTGSVSREHQRAVEADAAFAEAKGLYVTAKKESEDAHTAEAAAEEKARLAPIRTILLTVSLIGVLVAIAGGVIFALSFVSTALGFGRIIGVIGLIGGGAALILAQLINVALSHLVFVLAGAVAIGTVALVGWLIWDRHRGQQSTREHASYGDDLAGRMAQLGQTSIDAAKHLAAAKQAAVARQFAAGIKGRVEKTLARIRPSAATGPSGG